MSDFLGRESFSFPEGFWDDLDNVVNKSASQVLSGRKFLPFTLSSSEMQYTAIESNEKSEVFEDGFVKTTNKKLVEIPQLYSDFWLNWRDLKTAEQFGTSIDYSPAINSAHIIGKNEDKMIYYGLSSQGLDGLLTVKGSESIPLSDWEKGENAYIDVTKAVSKLENNDCFGSFYLIVSPDVYIKLQRIQQGTGLLESARIEKVLGNNIIKSIALEPKTALLVCASSHCMDLFVTQDIITSYLEAVDLNHHFRILETVVLRIKKPKSIVVFK